MRVPQLRSAVCDLANGDADVPSQTTTSGRSRSPEYQPGGGGLTPNAECEIDANRMKDWRPSGDEEAQRQRGCSDILAIWSD
jgi:hypothetical protein